MPTQTHKQLILGTAGHIDHGKSSLVKALTGVDPDRLSEEKERGITIELGFAQLDFDEGSYMGVVDVPGHERFVRQMIAGSSGIDIALLCIAADDGIMPQTLEHKAILELLDIPRIVVALTKCDLVDEDWILMITEEIQAFLSTSPYASAPIIPVSAQTGAGLDDLKNALRTSAFDTPRLSRGTLARLPIDRVFTIKGSGTVVTGTLWSGSVQPKDELYLLPQKELARVRLVQVHGVDVDEAFEGNRVALNLQTLSTEDVRPGDFLLGSAGIASSNRFDAYFTYLDTAKSGKPLKSGSRIHLSHGTREVVGRILFMGEQELLRSGESAYVQLRLEDELPVMWRDRFIVRSYSPVHVIGGGKILLAHPRHRTNLSAAEQELLRALNQEDITEVCNLAVQMQQVPFTLESLSLLTGLPADALQDELNAIQASGSLLRLGEEGKPAFYSTKTLMQKLLATLENHLLSFHAEHTQEAGISKAALMTRCNYRGDAKSFDALLTYALDEGRIHINEGLLHHPKVGGSVKKLEEETAEKLYILLSQGGAKPPTLDELVQQGPWDASLMRRALLLLENQGRVKRINKEFSFTTDALRELEGLVRSYLAVKGTATAAELKEAMKSSRKYSIPLLEHFDAEGITAREGDVRRLAQ